MPVIYTDERGQGYDYDQLASAYGAGQFEAGSRVKDILDTYRPTDQTPTVQAPIERPPAPDTLPGGGRRVYTYAAPDNPDGGDGGSGSGNPAGGGPGTTTPGGPNEPAPGNDANQVYGWYSTFLGRSAHPEEVAAWLGSGLSLGDIQHHIANSPEADAYAKARGLGKYAPPNPVPTPTGGGGGAAVSTRTPYDSSSQSLLLNAALQRLAQLQQPIDRTNEDLYTKYALARVSKLGGAPFSDQESAAMLAKHMEPLTQARDSAKKQAAEDLARRGITPSSGLFQDRMKAIDQAYERGVAGVTNTLNMAGIDQAQKNAAMQLQILDSLVNMGRMSRQEADQRSLEIVQTAGIPFDTDLRTLSALSAAGGGDNASSLISSLMSLGGLNLRGNELASAQHGQDAQALGSVIGYILSHHSDFGF